jgi:SAM-dependent methyltransferase
MSDEETLEPLRRIAGRIPGGMAMGRAVRRLIDPELRAIERLRRQGDTTYQPFPTTEENRYPEVFAALAERLAKIAVPRVLSFGCSDGSEVRTLRRWLPHAELVGIDINPRALARARRALRRRPDPLIRFHQASSTGQFPEGAFDAILAMAVFRHGELEATMPDSCSAILPFARFAAGVADLDRRLKPGGTLALWNAHYRFSDTPLADGYDAISLPASRGEPMELFYGRDDRRVEAEPYAEILFRKHS